MSDQKKPQLTEEELKNLREIHIPINLAGLRKGWQKIFYEAPFSIYQGAMRWCEGVSKRLMTGNASLLSMPVGIIIRNATRAAHNSSEGKYLYGARIAGGLAAIGAVAAGTFFGGPMLAAALPAVAGVIGSIGTYAAAGIGSLLVATTPAFTAGTLVTSSVLGIVIAGLSTVPAVANLVVAYKRSQAALKGHKLTEDQLQALEAEFDRESPSARYERQTLDQVNRGLRSLPEERRQEIFENLRADFEEAAKKKAEQEQAAVAAAAPAAKRAP